MEVRVEAGGPDKVRGVIKLDGQVGRARGGTPSQVTVQ